jgi:hypothetical protein
MPAMISRIVAAEFSFRWPVYRFAQVGGEFWPKIRFLPYDPARLGLPPQIRELAAQAAVYATQARGPGTLRVKRHPNLGHELERLKLLIF